MENEYVCGGFDEVHDVVQAGCQCVDVLAVERCDEGGKSRPPPSLALAGHRTAMALRDVPHDRKAKSRPPRFSRPGFVRAVEALEDPRKIFRRDADPAVANGESRSAILSPKADR